MEFAGARAKCMDPSARKRRAPQDDNAVFLRCTDFSCSGFLLGLPLWFLLLGFTLCGFPVRVS